MSKKIGEIKQEFEEADWKQLHELYEKYAADERAGRERRCGHAACELCL